MLYAQWTANTYTVTYNANGANVTEVPGNQTKTYDVALTLSTGVPTRTGYVFASWNTAANSSGKSYASGASYTDNASITLYAKWMSTYTVTYNANGGTGAPGNQTKTLGVTLTLSTDVPTREGYTFASWNTSANGSGTSYVPGASYTDNVGVTLYAQWSKSVVSNCDGQTFSTVVIGTQTWMAENLNCNVSGSKCYDNKESYCDTYGRLYDWATAMANSASSSATPSGVKDICPTGWHIPSDAEWTTLIDYAGGYSTAETKLKATSGWNDNFGKSGNGTDAYGFAALPGGYGSSGGYFNYVGNYGSWWSATEDGADGAHYWSMYYYNDGVRSYYDYKYGLHSVRCLQD
jgi:uncharacterized protein (TIGR02145 family)/uncharacterized repeat protein (TIGR02543 family)